MFNRISLIFIKFKNFTMWKLSKLALFIIFFVMTICAGISLIFVDWEVIKSGKNIVSELEQPVLFLLLSLYFMFPYVKKIKEENKKE